MPLFFHDVNNGDGRSQAADDYAQDARLDGG